MDARRQVEISIPQTLFEQAELLARRFGLSQAALLERALEDFMGKYAHEAAGAATDLAKRPVNRGDIYWVTLGNSTAPADAIAHPPIAHPPIAHPPIAHPYVVVQDNVLNHSRLSTVVACALTSNIRRASETPGNVLLEAGEGNLPRQSVVEVSKVSSFEKAQLGEYIGMLGESRVAQVLAGMRFLQRSFFNR
jgi:mRNA interferase MazF